MVEASPLSRPAHVPSVLDMSNSLTSPPPGIDAHDWRSFIATQANTLMVGDAPALMRALTAAWLTLRRPVVWCDDSRLRLPTGPVGTFIIWRVGILSNDDQENLSRWLECSESTRVIAAAPHALFPLTQQGIFSVDLYYRLNGVLLLAP